MDATTLLTNTGGLLLRSVKKGSVILLPFYFLFIFSNLYLGSYKAIGTYSLRVPLALLVLFSIFFLSKITKPPKIIIFLFPLLFLFSSFLSTIFNGEDLWEFIVNIVLANFSLTLILVLATLVLVPINMPMKKLLIFLALALSLNAVFIIGKYYDIKIFWTIANYFSAEDIFGDSVYSLFELRRKIYGIANTVYSGYLLAVALPFSLFIYHTLSNKILGIALILVNSIAAVLLQQRLAFILIIFSLIFFSKSSGRGVSKKLLLFLLLAALYFVFQYFIFTHLDTYGLQSRLINLEDHSRITILHNAIEYCVDNPVWGGIDNFIRHNNGVKPHFIIFDAWIRGGMIGLLSISIFLIIFINRTLRIILFKTNMEKGHTLWFVSLATFNILIMSLTHNPGLTSGDQLTYLLVTMFLIDRSRASINQKSIKQQYSYEKGLLN